MDNREIMSLFIEKIFLCEFTQQLVNQLKCETKIIIIIMMMMMMMMMMMIVLGM